jgi:hypothetical protein
MSYIIILSCTYMSSAWAGSSLVTKLFEYCGAS